MFALTLHLEAFRISVLNFLFGEVAEFGVSVVCISVPAVINIMKLTELRNRKRGGTDNIKLVAQSELDLAVILHLQLRAGAVLVTVNDDLALLLVGIARINRHRGPELIRHDFGQSGSFVRGQQQL